MASHKKYKCIVVWIPTPCDASQSVDKQDTSCSTYVHVCERKASNVVSYVDVREIIRDQFHYF